MKNKLKYTLSTAAIAASLIIASIQAYAEGMKLGTEVTMAGMYKAIELDENQR